MRQATQNWIVIAIGTFAGLLLVGGAVLYRDVSWLYNNSSWVAHSHEVTSGIEELLATIRGAEAAQRGYIITGRPEYLVPFEPATHAWRSQLAKIRILIADNPAQQERLSRIEDLLAAKVAEMRRVLDAFRAGGFDSAREVIGQDVGFKQMRDITTLVAEMQTAEEALLREREYTNLATVRSARFNSILATIVGLVALAATWSIVRHHVQAVEQSAVEIHRQRELLQATLISIGDGVIATDERSNVILVNAVAQRLTGWHESDALGKPLKEIFKIVNEETRLPVDSPAERALREGRIVGLANHTILIAKDGTEWPLDDSAAPIQTARGHIQGAVLVFREISDRKRQELQLVAQARELEEAAHRKDEFLATLSHELRNPLSPLSYALQLWPFVQDNHGELERLRVLMTRQVKQMTRLIDDLLDVSRITSGKIHLIKQQVDLKALIGEAIESIKPLLDANKQRLTVSLPEVPLYVDGDVARLTQVFGNILNNAVKFSGQQGAIEIRAAASNGHIDTHIRDNGSGIPAHMLETIFEMFRQGDGSLERTNGGLGIGLTLVKQLVTDHGGTVRALSAGPGQGSEFIVTLPAASADPANSPAALPRDGQLGVLPTKRILVVDDVKASAHTLAMMLRAIGQEVSEANDGPAALAIVATREWDVVFLDIAMPGMSGYEVARRLRAERPQLVLVALTGYGQEDDRRQALDAGFNHHLVKPTSIETLRQLLSSISPQNN